ncbi:MAG: acyl-CoA thioesterase [Treponema sp.]|nr:acyl-CoA thioesterase [Treponema sp.]
MFKITIYPRFGDLDALGHVNNTVPGFWFESGRTPIIRIFDPELSVEKKTFPLIIAHIDYDYVEQVFLKYDIEVRTFISRIGTKSFTVYHEAWQENRLCVKGNAVLVHYDFNKEESTPIPEDKKILLAEHLIKEG